MYCIRITIRFDWLWEICDPRWLDEPVRLNSQVNWTYKFFQCATVRRCEKVIFGTSYRLYSLRCISAAELHTVEQYSTPVKRQNPESDLHEQSIIKYSLAVQDTRPWRSWSENSAMMLLKSHVSIKSYSQYIKVIGLIQQSPTKSKW